MKIAGYSFDKPEPLEVWVTHGGHDICLKVQAVMDYKPFERLVPLPTPPKVKHVKTGEETFDTNDRRYMEAVQRYARLKTCYMLITSLAATEDLEWETVVADKPDTWERAEKELQKAFTHFGLQKIQKAILKANGLGEEMLEQARHSFLAFQSRQNG